MYESHPSREKRAQDGALNDRRVSIMIEWFAHEYSLEVLKRAPLIAPSRSFVFPQRVEDVERGALYVMVRAGAASWLGIFALGYDSPHTVTGVYPTPHPDRFLALAGGYAYFADASAPEQTQFLKQQPMVWIGYCMNPALLLLADHRTITAVGSEGVAWQTPPLSMEGLSEIRVEGAAVMGKGWDAISDQEHEFRVEMQDEGFLIRK
ncbi:MAG: hypothetical protein ABI383_00995 [Acidobacteriaceae bacterium]